MKLTAGYLQGRTDVIYHLRESAVRSSINKGFSGHNVDI